MEARARRTVPLHHILRFDRVAVAFAQGYLFGTGPALKMPLGIQAYVKTSPELEVPDIEFMLRTSPVGVQP